MIGIYNDMTNKKATTGANQVNMGS